MWGLYILGAKIFSVAQNLQAWESDTAHMKQGQQLSTSSSHWWNPIGGPSLDTLNAKWEEKRVPSEFHCPGGAACGDNSNHTSEVMGSELSTRSDGEWANLSRLLPRQCSTKVLQLLNMPTNCWPHLEGSLETREEIWPLPPVKLQFPDLNCDRTKLQKVNCPEKSKPGFVIVSISWALKMCQEQPQRFSHHSVLQQLD